MPELDYEPGEDQSQGYQEGSQGSEGQDAAGQGQKTVPLEVLQSVREEKKAEAQKRQELEDRLRQIEAQQAQAAPQQGQRQSQDPLEELDDDEFLTAGQVKKLRQQDQQQSQAVLAEMQLRQTTEDYDDVVQNHLPELIKQDPALQQDLANAPNPFRMAYRLGKEYKERVKGGQTGSTDQPDSQEQSELSKALEDQGNKPGSASQAGSSTQAPASGADRYSHMGRKSPEDLDAEIKEAKRQARAGG